MSRNSLLILFAVASTGLASPANAEDRDIGAKTPDAVEGICGEKGGSFFKNPEGTNWGCAYNGGGGILCDKDTGCLETTPTRTRPDGDRIPWGLAGLLGLIGLLGLGGRSARDRPRTAV